MHCVCLAWLGYAIAVVMGLLRSAQAEFLLRSFVPPHHTNTTAKRHNDLETSKVRKREVWPGPKMFRC
jgi:hypothetical protein